MIQFQKATFVRFGKYTNASLQFTEGFQVLYGGNEVGKSTIQLFLRVMLYGISSQRRQGEFLRDRLRVIPWNEKSAEGILRLQVDGKELEIYRKFGKTPAGDRCEIRDANSGEISEEYNPDTLGEQIFGVPVGVFERTFWLRQEGSCIAGKDEELHRRLLNLRDTGEESISATEILKLFQQEKRKIKAKDKRSLPGAMDLLQNQREEKMQERHRLLDEKQQRELLEQRMIAEKEILAQAEKKLEALQQEEQAQADVLICEAAFKRWNQAEELRKKAEDKLRQEAYIRYASLTDEFVKNAETLERRIETLDQSETIGYDTREAMLELSLGEGKEKRGQGEFLLGVVGLILGFVLGVLNIAYGVVIGLVLGLVGCACMVIGLLEMKKGKAMVKVAREKQGQMQFSAGKLQHEKEQLQKEYQEALNRYACNTVSELQEALVLRQGILLEAESLKQARLAILDGEDEAELKQQAEAFMALSPKLRALSGRSLAEEIQEEQKKQMDAVTALTRMQERLAYVYEGGRNPADVDGEIAQIDEDLKTLQMRLKAINLAEEVFARVYEQRKSDFTPQVNKKTNAYLAQLTGGRYGDVRVSEEYRLRIAAENGTVQEAEYFSCGTYAQVYFALRLALGSLIGTGTEPLLLDDFLMAYDDERATTAMELLSTLAQERQILFFTCHRRDAEKAEQIGVKVCHLEEEIDYGC